MIISPTKEALDMLSQARGE